ncbi:hypothetical protein, partial [Actinomadura sp. RB99]|uniref:hypothetical protein n=1 Tax=Actinomadura sp. RB99 TaxID=2691577 RepID=UPI001682B56E
MVRTGWHDTPEGRVYVYPDGRTFPEGRRVHLVGVPGRTAAAAAPDPAADALTDAEVRARVVAVAERGGWAPLLGLAAGARTLGQSIRPVPSALLVVGAPGSGKSSTASAGRALVLNGAQWPPVATSRMKDTITDVEIAADTEADMPTLHDDLALHGEASALERRTAVEQLERLIRPLANNEAIRGRRNRDMSAQQRRYVRSIAVITAQQLPAGMQASLYRRAVILNIEHGDADVDWWKPAEFGGGNGAIDAAPALRVVGDRIIA